VKRFAPTSKAAPVTHEELQEAIRRFQMNGGIIHKLPDQKLAGHHAAASKEGLAESGTTPDTAI